MGQKVNPIVFRQAVFNSQISSWFSKKDAYSHLNNQDLEIRNFLSFLLKSRGIILRSCKINRAFDNLSIDLDLYFSYLLSKESKSFWAKTFFKGLKKKYSNLNRIKDLKIFVENLNIKEEEEIKNVREEFKVDSLVSTKNYIDTKEKVISEQKELLYKHRFFFFLLLKQKKNLLLKKKKKLSVLSLVKRSNIAKIVRIKLPKLKKLFLVKKLNYSFSNFCTNKFFFNTSYSNLNLLTLNKFLCQSLQHFTGLEKINICLHSNQLNFIPSLKIYTNSLLKELNVFQRNRDVSKYFFEILETLYFVTGTFSYGNASLLAKLLTFLLENNRRHVSIVRFIKKTIQVFFTTLPSDFFAINGIKILIKGRLNKRRRTKTFVIQQGQIALQTLGIPLDYYQTHAVTMYGTFGIKVWLSKSLNKI